MPRPVWMNRTVVGAGVTSFLADCGYELACSLLPSFLLLLGLPTGQAAQVLGAVEAAAEFLSNAAKILVGWWSDRVGKRKTLVVSGYVLTGAAFGLCALAVSWPLVLAAKSLAWLGKGIRGPLRNAIITDAVDPGSRGRAFGFHRAGDSIGAVVGPLVGAAILWFTASAGAGDLGAYRTAFWLTLIPGLGSAVAFAVLVREQRFTPKPGLRLGASIRALPKEYRRFLLGVGLFGMGDFGHSILILAATASFAAAGQDAVTAAVFGILLYAWRNLWQAIGSFPAGWAGDRFGLRPVLVGGYVLAAVTMAGFAVAVGTGSTVAFLVLFALAGLFMAIQDTLEPAIVPDLVPDKTTHGTAFGVLAVVNGFGDVAASLIVGGLVFAAGWPAGLGFAAVMMTVGAVVLGRRA